MKFLISLLVLAVCGLESVQSGWLSNDGFLTTLENKFANQNPVDLKQLKDWISTGKNIEKFIQKDSSVYSDIEALKTVIGWNGNSLIDCRVADRRRNGKSFHWDVDITNVAGLIKKLDPTKSLHKTILDKVLKRIESCSERYNRLLIPSSRLEMFVEGVAETSDVCRGANKSDPMWKYKCMTNVEFSRQKFAPGVLRLLQTKDSESFSKIINEKNDASKEFHISELLASTIYNDCMQMIEVGYFNVQKTIEAIRFILSATGKRPGGISEETLIKAGAVLNQCNRYPLHNKLASEILKLI